MISRMREAYDETGDTNHAISLGLARTGKLVTSAALDPDVRVLRALLEPRADIKQFGIGLAAGIIFDATVIRALLVPSLMRLMGEWNWWMPRFAARALFVPYEPDAAGAGHRTGLSARRSTTANQRSNSGRACSRQVRRAGAATRSRARSRRRASASANVSSGRRPTARGRRRAAARTTGRPAGGRSLLEEAEGDDERDERVRDRRVAPVEDAQPLALRVDVRHVEVVVLDRLRRRRARRARRTARAKRGANARKPVDLVASSGSSRRSEVLVARRQRRDPQVGDAVREVVVPRGRSRRAGARRSSGSSSSHASGGLPQRARAACRRRRAGATRAPRRGRAPRRRGPASAPKSSAVSRGSNAWTAPHALNQAAPSASGRAGRATTAARARPRSARPARRARGSRLPAPRGSADSRPAAGARSSPRR